jgi:hypothetical protein
MHVHNLYRFFNSIVENVLDVLLGFLVGASVLKFIRLGSDPNVHLRKTVKNVHFVVEQVLLLESWHFAHSCVSCFVGYLEQTCVEVV